ncbi:MAG: NADH-quinone oxidoreductase subunit NuoK [Coriobacteriia bacterium]
MSVIVLCAALFSIGLYGVLTRREVVAVLACAEVMLGAATVQAMAFAAGRPDAAQGQALGVVLVALAAAEAAVGLAVVVAVARSSGRSRVEDLTEVRG